MRYYCTYFDSNYLARGLALYRSLARHAGSFRLWVLCLDDEAYAVLGGLALPGLEPVVLADLEAGDEALLIAKSNRSRVEYYFTATSSLVLYLLHKHPEVDALTYLDADTYFFADPAPIEAEFAAGSVLIIAHRFSPSLRYLESRGIYNVGYVSFRRDEAGLACLRWWRGRCLEWCYDREEPGRFADQKYLDQWPALFPGVISLQHPGGGLAPWNMANYGFALAEGKPQVDGCPLVLVHFHGLKQAAALVYNPGLLPYAASHDHVLKHAIYGPYLRELWEAARCLQRVTGRSRQSVSSLRGQHIERPKRYGWLSAAARAVRPRIEMASRVARGDLWLVLGGRLV